MLVKQDYENKIKNQRFSKSNKKVFLKKESPTLISVNQKEINAILYSANNDKNTFNNILRKLNVNEDIINSYK